jgi:phosphoadenosine phosphosulfate reductase
MPLEAMIPPAEERALELNRRFTSHAAIEVLRGALSDPTVGRVALVSSFGTEAVVLLHMVAMLDRTTPVLFADTEMLFDETIAYQEMLAERFGLSDVRRVRPGRGDLLDKDADGILHVFDTDACCALRKTRPLQAALEPFDAWITGRKRFQGGARRGLELFEAETERRIKVNPLAFWRRGDVEDYITNNRLPRHPLVTKGFSSVGCAPCTTPVAPGEDPRAGRWRGQAKEECGIHFVDGKLVRQ